MLRYRIWHHYTRRLRQAGLQNQGLPFLFTPSQPPRLPSSRTTRRKLNLIAALPNLASLHTATSPGWPAKPRPAFPLHSFTASQAAPPVMCLTRARQEGLIPNCCATDSGITTQGDFARPTSTSKGDSFASSHRHFNNHHQHGHQGPSPQPVRCASRPGIEKVVPRARGLGHLP